MLGRMPELLAADGHADSLMWNRDLTVASGEGHVDFPRMRQGGVRLQEQYSLSLDGRTLKATISFTSKLVFKSEYCSNPENYHDC